MIVLTNYDSDHPLRQGFFTLSMGDLAPDGSVIDVSLADISVFSNSKELAFEEFKGKFKNFMRKLRQFEKTLDNPTVQAYDVCDRVYITVKGG